MRASLPPRAGCDSVLINMSSFASFLTQEKRGLRPGTEKEREKEISSLKNNCTLRLLCGFHSFFQVVQSPRHSSCWSISFSLAARFSPIFAHWRAASSSVADWWYLLIKWQALQNYENHWIVRKNRGAFLIQQLLVVTFYTNCQRSTVPSTFVKLQQNHTVPLSEPHLQQMNVIERL